MTGRQQEHQTPPRATARAARKPGTTSPAAPTPLAGLARAVAGETTDVMGGQAVPGEVAAAIRRRAGKGAALPGAVAEDFGARLGTDLSGVRIHADAEADTIARSVQAKAFTLGHDIYFSQGTYAPGSRSGRSLLAHELTHVRQHQQGTHRGAGGLTVGRVDDPAEREAETVARQLDAGVPVAGAPVPQGGGGVPGTAHRCVGSPTGTVRRLFGLFGASGAAALRDGEPSTDDEAIPAEFVDLVDAIQAVPELGKAENLKWDGSAYDDLDTVGNTGAMAGIGGTLGVVGGVKELYGGVKDLHEGRKALGHGRTEYDFGTIDGQAVKAKDSASRNLGATKLEAGTATMLSGGLGGASGVSSFMDFASTEIPFIDVAGNYYQAGIKGKKAIEDGVAAHRLQGQKVHIKREQDKFLPLEWRAKRFGQFATAWNTQKGLKSDDKKRWPLFLKKWQDSRPAPAPAATATTTTATATGTGTAGTGTATAAAFDPLTADWAAFASAADPQKKEMTDFLEFLGRTETKDFGYGTDLRKEYEKSLTTDVGGAAARTKVGSGDYEQMRDLGKVASFGHRRKAESASVNAVEAAGHALDATGTFTAAGDMGATKITGKALKAGSALYKGAKSLVKRAKDVHELRTAKNEMEYGGEKDRGVLWGAQQFFVGKLDDQAKKAKGVLKAGSTALQQHAVAKAAHDAYLAARQKWQDDVAAEAKKLTTEMPTLPAKVAESRAKASLPEPAAVPDPGPAPTTATAAGAKSAKALTAEQAKPLIKKLTKQCKRKVDDLIACLLSDNETVRNRARRILHILAETNLAGALEKIDDADLDVLYKVHVQMGKDATYAATHKVEFKKRKSAIKEILTSQLKGIGD